MNSQSVILTAIVSLVAIIGLVTLSNPSPTGNAMCGVNEEMKVMAVENGVTIWGCTIRTTFTMTRGSMAKENLVSGPFGVRDDPYIARPDQRDFTIGPNWEWDPVDRVH